ncbi:MAG: DUF6398 domain-containing protein [Thermoleophilia bacterium]|nr:DUF6398 domain-containing protein [Thermoleophilia bacterium]
MTPPKAYKVPHAMQARYEAVTTITDRVCRDELGDEYADLCRKAAAELSRKRPSPLGRGRELSWAAGILYALSQINFLFDKDSDPFLSARDLCEKVGVSQGTASRHAKEVRDLLDLRFFHPEYTLESLAAENPFAWMIMVDGMIVDARTLPLELREEAFELGLIPYVPEGMDPDDGVVEVYDAHRAPDPDPWLELDEDERIALVLEHHRQAGEQAPNMELHAMIHAVVETQVALGDEEPTAATLIRLQEEGLDRHDALHAIGSVLAHQMHRAVTERGEVDDPQETFRLDLAALTATGWRASG